MQKWIQKALPQQTRTALTHLPSRKSSLSPRQKSPSSPQLNTRMKPRTTPGPSWTHLPIWERGLRHRKSIPQLKRQRHSSMTPLPKTWPRKLFLPLLPPPPLCRLHRNQQHPLLSHTSQRALLNPSFRWCQRQLRVPKRAQRQTRALCHRLLLLRLHPLPRLLPLLPRPAPSRLLLRLLSLRTRQSRHKHRVAARPRPL